MCTLRAITYFSVECTCFIYSFIHFWNNFIKRAWHNLSTSGIMNSTQSIKVGWSDNNMRHQLSSHSPGVREERASGWYYSAPAVKEPAGHAVASVPATADWPVEAWSCDAGMWGKGWKGSHYPHKWHPHCHPQHPVEWWGGRGSGALSGRAESLCCWR